MIDTAKVADLVLLMVDGSFGFEMVRSLSSHLAPPAPRALTPWATGNV